MGGFSDCLSECQAGFCGRILWVFAVEAFGISQSPRQWSPLVSWVPQALLFVGVLLLLLCSVEEEEEGW